MIRINNVITKINVGQMAYGVNLSFTSSTMIELSGRVGLDLITFDSEHGPFTIDLLDDLWGLPTWLG